MATLTPGALSELNEVLREAYWGKTPKLFKEASFYTANLVTKTGEAIEGRYLKVPVQITNGANAMARGPYEDIQIGGGPTFTSAQFTAKSLYATTAIQGQALDQAHKSGKVVDILATYMDDMKSAASGEVARCVWGDGSATIDGASITNGSAVVTPTDPRTVRTGKVYPGMTLNVGPAGALDSYFSNAKVIAVDYNASTFTLDSNAAATHADGLLSVPGNVNTDGTNVREPDGLQSAISISPNTFGGINEATVPMWAPLRKDESGSPSVSFDTFDKALNRLSIRFGDSQDLPVWTTVTTHGLARLTYDLFRGDVRYLDPGNVSTGRKTMEITNGDITFRMRSDAGCPTGRVYWFVLDDLIWVSQQGEWAPFNGGQATLVQGATAAAGGPAVRDAYWWGVYQYVALGVERRDRCLVQYGLTDPGE